MENKNEVRPKRRLKKLLLIVGGLFILIIIIVIANGGDKKKEIKSEITQPPQQEIQKYPSFTEETMDRNFILSCIGGDEVVLWDKPTDAAGGARFRDRVPCGTFGWAFNKYYNEEHNITFYAVNTLDPRVKNTYGWITEDLITWRE